MNKKWELYNSNEKDIKEVIEKYDVGALLASVLVSRNIINTEESDKRDKVLIF